MRSPTSRRTFLRGLGACVALPWLESLAPRQAWASPSPTAPKRFVSFMVPNGMPMDRWHATGTGTGWTPSAILTPLTPHRDAVTLLSGIHNTLGVAGVEPHAARSVAYLTGRNEPGWTPEASSPHLSIDQLLAQSIGTSQRFPSLHLTSEGVTFCAEATGGSLPSCRPYDTVSWADAQTAIPHEFNVRRAFERLFAAQPDANPYKAARDRRLELAVVDAVLEDAATLQRTLSHDDRQRLDQYLTGIHELERRIVAQGAIEADPVCATSATSLVDSGRVDDTSNVSDHVDVMLDLMVLAMQCDQSRVFSYMLGAARSDRPFPHLGIPESHHAISHHGGDEAKLAKLATIGTWEVAQFASFLARLEAVTEGDHTLLDQAIVLFGSPISDPHLHDHIDLPLIIGGRGGGAITPGARVVYGSPTPLARLHVTLARRMGLDISSFGDEAGVAELTGW